MRWIAPFVLLCLSGTLHAQSLGLRHARDSCSSDAVELMFELSASLESGNVNRVAALYDWNNMGSAAGRGVMDRLEVLAGRTLLDVVPVYPEVPADPYDAMSGLPAWPVALADRPPVGLRVEQLLDDGATPVSTTFAVRSRMGCWWVVF
jgi:hypothetical protein